MVDTGSQLWLALDFSRWKQGFIGQFLGAEADVVFVARDALASRHAEQANVLAWSSKVDDELVALCTERGWTLWRIEDGFVRSAGLGTDLVAPLSLALDRRGIYYDATAVSDLELMLEHRHFSAPLLRRARAVREQLVELKLSKYNVGNEGDALELPADYPIILVPGQVETDASIAKGSPEIRTNHALLSAVRSARPDAFILYKPHPDVLAGGRIGELSDNGSELYDLLVTETAITDLFARVDEVHTMSSLSGFEALLRGCKVVTWGMPFYAGWGLTDDILSCERRTRMLTLDELVAAALICYPRYVDPDSGQLCEVERVMEILHQQRHQGRNPTFSQRLYRGYRALIKGKR